MSVVLVAALAAGSAAALAFSPRPRRTEVPRMGPERQGSAPGVGAEAEQNPVGPANRLVAGLSAGACVALLLGGTVGVLGGALVGAWVLRATGRVGRGRERARAEEASADLPALVGLFAAGLRAGSPAPTALDRACLALPGAAADRLAPVRARLLLGVPPGTVWGDLVGDDVLAPLGRTLVRAHRTGAPVARAVDALAAELASTARSEVEDRARAVGVRAALPLGLCLLPGFLLLGIVPLVASLVSGLVW